MNISLTTELENFVKSSVSSGLYASDSEVIRDGLRLLRTYKEVEQAKLAALKAEIQSGVASLDQGKGISGPVVFAKMDAFLNDKVHE